MGRVMGRNSYPFNKWAWVYKSLTRPYPTRLPALARRLPRRRHSQSPTNPSSAFPLPSIPTASSARSRQQKLQHRRPARRSPPSPPPPASVAHPSSRYHEGGSGFGPQHHHWGARRPRLVILSVADASDMLPGLSPPPPPVLMGGSYVPSLSPSAMPSSSIGASIAIIAAIIIAAAILTCCIVVLRLSSRRRMSGSSFSRRRSISPKASLSAESEMSCAAAAAVGASIRVNASFLKNAEVYSSGLEVPVPSAPCLPEGERVILELLSQSPVLVQPGSSMFSCFCGVFVPTDTIVALPVCSHKFHQLCIVAWILRPADSCPFCDTPITTPCADKTSLAPVYSSDQYDIEAMMIVPAPPGEEVTEAVGVSRGWLRSSLDRLSGRWRGCSSNHATAVVVPVSSQHTTKSGRLDNTGHLGIDSNGVQKQSGEEVEAVGGSRGWLRSYLATLSSTWSGRSDSRSTTVVLPLSSGRATGRLSLVPSGCGNTDSWSRSWDLEASEKRT